MADYTILIKAKLDLTEGGIKGIKDGLKALSEKINTEKLFQIKPTLDLSGFDTEFNKIKGKIQELQRLQGTVKNIGSTAPQAPEGVSGLIVNDPLMQSNIDRVMGMHLGINSETPVKIQQFTNALGEVNKVVRTYIGNNNEAVVITQNLIKEVNKETGEETERWQQSVKYSADIVASLKEEEQAKRELAKSEEAYSKMRMQADAENAAFDKKRLDVYNQMTSRLETFQARNADAFKTVKVDEQLQKTLGLLDQFSKGKVGIEQVRNAYGKLTTEVVKTNDQIRTTHKSTDNFTTALEKNIGKVIQWAIATGAVYTSLRYIREGITYISELNKVMTDTQIVSGATNEQIRKLSFEYNALAKEVGATTLEVAKGSLEWVRQGKSTQETAMLLRNSMMMSKLAALDAAQATEYMTSIMNGFQLEAEDTMGVLDKLVILDNNYATSVGEIASAMQRSSNSAMQAGVTLEELASYIK